MLSLPDHGLHQGKKCERAHNPVHQSVKAETNAARACGIAMPMMKADCTLPITAFTWLSTESAVLMNAAQSASPVAVAQAACIRSSAAS